MSTIKIKKEDGSWEYVNIPSIRVDPSLTIEGEPADAKAVGTAITNLENRINDNITSNAEANKLLKLNDEAKLPADITGNAATVGGKSASDFVSTTDVVITVEANKLLKLNDEAKLPADITGNAATVGGKSASDFVGIGDVSTTAEANKLLKLNNDGKLPADITGNAATATNVQWSGVQNKPNTLAGYGITDVATARSDLGLGDVATENIIPITKGGTGAIDAATARSNLGAAPMYDYGTTDLTAGSSPLETGKLYFVYE